jgi:hypothetical protein
MEAVAEALPLTISTNSKVTADDENSAKAAI